METESAGMRKWDVLVFAGPPELGFSADGPGLQDARPKHNEVRARNVVLYLKYE